MRYGERGPARQPGAWRTLSLKIGLVLLVLGALHFFNVFALNRYRRGRLRQQQPAAAAAGRPAADAPHAAAPPPAGRRCRPRRPPA